MSTATLNYRLPYHRRHNELVVTLTKQQKQPPPLPFELAAYLGQEEWYSRVGGLMRVLRRWEWSLFERVWTVVALLATLILPWPLISVADRAILNNHGMHFATARLIGFGILFGIFIVFWVPVLVWNRMAKVKTNGLVRQFTAADAARGPHFAVTWNIRPSSFARAHADLVITLPVVPTPSVYDPNAYLPSYIAARLPGYGAGAVDFRLADEKQAGGPQATEMTVVDLGPPLTDGAPSDTPPVKEQERSWPWRLRWRKEQQGREEMERRA